MRKNILFSMMLTFLASSLAIGQDEGINFTSKAWKKVLQSAKDKDKLIFVDAYTTWCGPCKKMAKEIFPQPEVASFYNKNFINVQMDMEKGEGLKLAQDYQVRVYPTLLFVDGEGKLVHRAAGYQDAAAFVSLGTTALDPSNRMSSMEKRFANGDREVSFLKKYAELRYTTFDGSHVPVAEAYMETQEDWNTEENRAFIFQYIGSTDSKLFDHLVDNRETYLAQFGQKEVTAKIQGLIFRSIQDSREKSSLEQIDELFKKAYPERAAFLSSNFRMTYYRQAGDRDNFAKSAIKHYKKYKTDDPVELNDIAWTFYTVVEKKKQLKKAVKWAKKSVKMEDSFYNNDTLAALYYKLGKKKKAIKTAKKAIDLAIDTGQDSTETERLLKEIYKL